MSLFTFLLGLPALLLSLPIGVLLTETLAALVVRQSSKAGQADSRPIAEASASASQTTIDGIVTPTRATQSGGASPRTVILIPAHNEASIIGQTLGQLKSQLDEASEVVVVADNCSDATATIARQHGATVFERRHEVERGKGYALAYGLAQLAADPPDVVFILDADCTVAAGGVARLAQRAQQLGVPLQAVYLQKPPPSPSASDLVSAFAFQVKNLVRPLGLFNLGQPCLLTGSGMAFPYEVLRRAPLASGNIVEDMQLGYDLALAGFAPQLAPDVTVWGQLPAQKEAATSQRTRWEHGHIQTLLSQGPRLLLGGLRRRQPALVTLALDLTVPPLALLSLLWSFAALLAIISSLVSGKWLPALASLLSGIGLGGAIGFAWLGFGHRILPLRKLLAVPVYIAWKVPLYLNFVLRRQTAWVRTARERERTIIA